MKKLLVLTAAVAVLVGSAVFTHPVHAQGNAAAAGASTTEPSRVGLIDMAEVFKNYKKFEAMRADLKTEIEAADAQTKKQQEQLQILQTQLKELTEGSPEYLAREEELAKKVSELETFVKVSRRDFMRKEAQIYKTVYLEVGDAVQRAADHYHYTIVIRFNRDELQSEDAPEEVLKKMNYQVIYHQKQDDITDAVLDFLDRRYTQVSKQTGGAKQPAAPR